MGKPQSNFQYRTIFGVPLIAGNKLKKSSYEKINQKVLAITRQELVSCTRCMRRVYFLAYNSRNYFKVDNIMKLLSKVNLEETDFPGEGYFRDEAFEVEEVIGGRTALLYFDVEVVAYFQSEETGSFRESEIIHVEYQDGYFKDDGDLVVVTNDRVRSFENKLEKLIKLEL